MISRNLTLRRLVAVFLTAVLAVIITSCGGAGGGGAMPPVQQQPGVERLPARAYPNGEWIRLVDERPDGTQKMAKDQVRHAHPQAYMILLQPDGETYTEEEITELFFTDWFNTIGPDAMNFASGGGFVWEIAWEMAYAGRRLDGTLHCVADPAGVHSYVRGRIPVETLPPPPANNGSGGDARGWLAAVPVFLAFFGGVDPTAASTRPYDFASMPQNPDPDPDPDPDPLNQPPTVSLTPSTVNISVGGTANFLATANDADGTIVLYEWDLDGDGQFETSGGNSNSKSRVYNTAGSFTVTVRVTDNDGAKATDTSMVVVADVSLGKTLDGKPYTDSKAFLILTPEDTTIDEATNDYQQLWPVVAFPTMTEVLRQDLWSIQSWETTAPSGALTNGGMFSAVIAGPGTYTVRANVELKTYIGSTLAPTARVAETDINVIGGHSGSRAVSYVGIPYISPTTGRWTCDIWLR